MHRNLDIQGSLTRAVEIWGQRRVAETLRVERETVNRWLNKKQIDELNRNHKVYLGALEKLLPRRPKRRRHDFKFIDLFAGIGGLRRAFEKAGGECVFTSEWDEQARRTYLANYYCDHPVNGDIREITSAAPYGDELLNNIDRAIPDHHVLLAGFPCQPFSIAGVSKKNALGRAHGFDCKIQGTLFFDICQILKAKQPACFLLENVKNLKSHNKGDTYTTIVKELKNLGYEIPEPRVINARDFVPQHRERIVIVGFRKDLDVAQLFDFSKVKPRPGRAAINLGHLLESDNEVESRYQLTPKLWEYLRGYKEKHRTKGNGFGYDIFTPDSAYTRTLSARYYKDGSEILIAKNEQHAEKCMAGEDQPRRLTPRECARLMGFEKPLEDTFKIPVSDTQAYKQFGNSVVVPVFEAVAKQMRGAILNAVALEKAKQTFPVDDSPQSEIQFAAL